MKSREIDKSACATHVVLTTLLIAMMKQFFEKQDNREKHYVHLLNNLPDDMLQLALTFLDGHHLYIALINRRFRQLYRQNGNGTITNFSSSLGSSALARFVISPIFETQQGSLSAIYKMMYRLQSFHVDQSNTEIIREIVDTIGHIPRMAIQPTDCLICPNNEIRFHICRHSSNFSRKRAREQTKWCG